MFFSLICFFLLENKYDPFLTKTLYNFDLQGMLLNIFVLFFTILNEVGGYKDFKLVFTIIFFIAHILFYLYWAYQIILKRVFIQMIVKKIRQKLQMAKINTKKLHFSNLLNIFLQN